MAFAEIRNLARKWISFKPSALTEISRSDNICQMLGQDKEFSPYSSTSPDSFVSSTGILPVMFFPDNVLQGKKFSSVAYYFIEVDKYWRRSDMPLCQSSYIENTLGASSELHCTQDHDAGKHGSPPSCAQPACEYRDTMLAMMFAVNDTCTNLIKHWILLYNGEHKGLL